AAPVSRQKHDPVPGQGAETEFVRGLAERARHAAPLDIGQPVDAVKPTAADDADNPAGHFDLTTEARRSQSLIVLYSVSRVALWRISVDAGPDLALGGIEHAGRDDQ